jgi:hypothetical protein
VPAREVLDGHGTANEPSRARDQAASVYRVRRSPPSPFWFVSMALALAGCGGVSPTDAGVDAARLDGGVDAFVPVDGGPERPRALDVQWLERIESTEALAASGDARLAPLPGGGFVLSLPLGGAPAVLAPGTAGEQTVGDAALNRATQVLAWYDGDGTLRAARAAVVADPVLDGFFATGRGVSAFGDGSLVLGGQFHAGARFGGDDPSAVTFATVREMPARDLVVTSVEGFVARFDPAREITWARRARSETGFAELSVTDVAALADGGVLVLGGYDEAVVLGEGERAETRFTLAPGAEQEVFLARYAADGALIWARQVRGQATPTRLLGLEDGSSLVLLRHGADVTLGPGGPGGPGEPAETVVAGPPTGVLEGDVVARYDADGRLVWARAVQADATTYPGLRALRVEGDALLVAGTFRGRVEWPGAPEATPFEAYGVEGLLARLSLADGAFVWQRRLRPTNTLQVQALAPAAGGESWVGASVSMHGATFAPEGGEPLVLEGSSDSSRLVLLRYDLDGVLRAAHLVARDDVDLDDVLPLSDGDLVLVGRYGEGTVIEPGTEAERALPPALAFRNVFVARYSPRR